MNKVVYSKKIKSREGRLMMQLKSECCWIPTIFCKSEIRRIYRLILSWIRFGKSTFIIAHLQSAVSHANTANSYFLIQNTESDQNLSSDSVFSLCGHRHSTHYSGGASTSTDFSSCHSCRSVPSNSTSQCAE